MKPTHRKPARGDLRCPSGFTMVEWLAAAGLIGCMAVLAQPHFETVRENARAAQCRENMRSIAFAVLDYENEHGVLPGPIFRRVRTPVGEPDPRELNWIMDDYFGPGSRVWVCPTNAALLDESVNPGSVVFVLLNLQDTNPPKWFGHLDTPNPTNPMAIKDIVASSQDFPFSRIRELRRIWMISDADGWNYDAASIGGLAPDSVPIDSNVGPVHRGGRNFVFFDGHAEFLMPVDFPLMSGRIRN